jgi:hypothetical protein
MRHTGPQQYDCNKTAQVTARRDSDAVYVSDIQPQPTSLASSVQAYANITDTPADKQITVLVRAICTSRQHLVKEHCGGQTAAEDLLHPFAFT